MNYSNAVKGQLTRSTMTSYVFSQAESELHRPLNKEEEALLFEKYSIKDIFNRIHKVSVYYSVIFVIHWLFLVWVWYYQVSVAALQQAGVELRYFAKCYTRGRKLSSSR